MQAHQAVLPVEAGFPLALHAGVHEGGAGFRRDVGGDRDHAVAAMGHVAQGRGVVAGQQHPVGTAQQALHADAGQVAGGVLDADDVGQLGQARQGLVGDVDAGATGHVVDEHRQLNGVVDRLVVLIHALLAGAIVVRRHHQGRVGADGLGVAGQLDGLVGRVAARAGDHRHAAGGGLHAQLDDALVLVMRQGRGLARGADRHQAVHAAGDLALDQRYERFFVHLTVAERRDEGRNDALEVRLDHDLQIAVRMAPRVLRQDNGGGQYVRAPSSRNGAP